MLLLSQRRSRVVSDRPLSSVRCSEMKRCPLLPSLVVRPVVLEEPSLLSFLLSLVFFLVRGCVRLLSVVSLAML